MQYFKNDVASFYSSEQLYDHVIALCALIKRYPFIINPLKGVEQRAKEILEKNGFVFYPTVESTTLLYREDVDCFFKILHPINFKNRLRFFFFDNAKHIYKTAEHLLEKGIRVTKILAYGKLKKGHRPFFVIKRAEGKSLYDLLVRERNSLNKEVYLHVIEEISKLHNLGYWLGDAHLSHIFIKDNKVSGIIDIDSIRKNIPFRYQNLAKDLAGLNHPELPITENDRMSLLNYYFDVSGIKKRKKFLKLLKHYTERRWKA